MKPRWAWALVVSLGLALSAPLVVSLAEPDLPVSMAERRRLAPPPRFDEGLRSLPARIAYYLEDHIGFRDRLLRWNSLLKVRLLGVSPSDDVVVGRDGWFFVADPLALAQHRRATPLSESILSSWEAALKERRAWLSERGIPYLFAFVPNKHTVYADYMPDAVSMPGVVSQLDQLVQRIAARTQIPFVDLRVPLNAARAGERLYERTGTHWNRAGAYVAYEAILAKLRGLVPSLADAAPVEVRRERRLIAGRELVASLHLEDEVKEEAIDAVIVSARAKALPSTRFPPDSPFRRIDIDAMGTLDAEAPRAVVFGDSFMEALAPFLAEHFSRVVFVAANSALAEIVKIEAPDVVIQERVERMISMPQRGFADRASHSRAGAQ